MNKDIEQRIAWINERVPLDGLQISYIKFQMQEHTKPLIEEIEQQKMQCSVYHNDILNLEGEKAGLIDEIADLKSRLELSEQKVKLNYNTAIDLESKLKASGSVNEALQKSHDELLKIAKHYIKNHDYWVIANADKLTRNNK